MSELKVYHCNEWHNEYTEFYLKYEADKVIAEFEERIADGDKDFEMANNQNERLLKIVRHQKYKRCLAMAWFCHYIAAWDNEVYVHGGTSDDRLARLYWKWEKRWLELAKKFEEAK